MIEKPRLKRILLLSLPIMGGMVSQNILNLVDTAMVGKLGNAALAAVGIGGFATFMFQALLMGFSTGVQASSSRRKGEGNLTRSAHPLNTGILIVLVLGTFLTCILYPSIDWLYPYLNSDPKVIEKGAPYLEMRTLGSIFVGINFCFRGFWNAVDRSKIYFTTLLIAHPLNIIFNFILIFGMGPIPAMGTEGAALGTVMANGVSTLIHFMWGFKLARPWGFLKGKPTLVQIKTLCKISVPNSIQQLFFAGGFTALYWIIGQIGTRELAAANVLINLILITILPSIGLGLGATTLVGQALGRKDPADAKKWGFEVAKLGVFGIGSMGIPLVLFPDFFMSFFLHDPKTLEIARWPLMFSGATLFSESAGLILMNALLGAGDSKIVMKVSILLQWVFFLPGAFLIGPYFGGSLLSVWALQGIYRAIQAIIFVYLWNNGKWQKIKI